MNLVARKKIEVLADQPLLSRVAEIVMRNGATGYTILPAAGGMGQSGPWADDQVTSAAAKAIFVTVVREQFAEPILTSLQPLLDSYGMIVWVTAVEVNRGHRF